MIDSRNLNELHPRVRALAEVFLDACKAAGVDVLVTSTYRDHEAQDALYAKGRTAPGAKVTNSKGGQSLHNFRVAFDVVPRVDGKLLWTTSGATGKLWENIGALGEYVGLEWGGRWKTFPDYPHFQFTGGLSLADFQAGETLEEK
ncbi:MAG: M15 family metallopeptidase [Candidatus Accumulibacter sp.]|jgi:peptidoglycan L-alanyl-D-glutamate endopeptidase CwlK|nr:M15 family metallopeptidase [Accumulibacter sp.]